MNTNEKNKRPILLSIVVLYVILNTLPKITGILFVTPSIKKTNPELFAHIQSLPPFMYYSPLVIGILLIISMVLLFLLRKSSLIVYAIYFALELTTSIWKALTPNFVEMFGTKGVNSLFGSIAMSAIVFGYMIWLWKDETLN